MEGFGKVMPEYMTAQTVIIVILVIVIIFIIYRTRTRPESSAPPPEAAKPPTADSLLDKLEQSGAVTQTEEQVSQAAPPQMAE